MNDIYSCGKIMLETFDVTIDVRVFSIKRFISNRLRFFIYAINFKADHKAYLNRPEFHLLVNKNIILQDYLYNGHTYDITCDASAFVPDPVS